METLPLWLPDYVREYPDKVLQLGHDHFATWVQWSPDRELNPMYADIPDIPRYGVHIFHKRPDNGEPCSGAVAFDLPEVQALMALSSSEWERKRPVWQVESFEPLTISPSVLCRAPLNGKSCDDHGFIKNGLWQVA